ncbi:hypothetical protein [Actinomadura sp. 6N118]|uniref:hypothetical protein n=1 Tax=Actinomadura sp. 6N118 TaxID=3375151 RepID=UPI00379273A2
MTDQPFQPPQNVRTEEDSAVQYLKVVGPRGQGFQVLSLDPGHDEPGLVVHPNQPDSDEEEDVAELPSHAIGSNGVEFKATVEFTGNEAWKIGWVQTVEPSDYWVLYRNGVHAAKYHRTLPQRMRDSDAPKGCWYGTEAREKADSAKPVTVELSDSPAAPFYFGGPGQTDLVGWVPTECGGEKEYWTWLVAVKDDDHRLVDVVYLHHIHWKVVFACEIGGDAQKPTVNVPVGSGVVLLDEGDGQGGATPVLDGPGVRPRDEVSKVEHLPDRDQQ